MNWWLMVIIYLVGAALFGTLSYLMREDLHSSAKACDEEFSAADCENGHGVGFVFGSYVLWPLVFPGALILWVMRGHLREHFNDRAEEHHKRELEKARKELDVLSARKQVNAAKLDIAEQERLLSDGQWPRQEILQS